ncbi:inosine triphosphate pyrophosphatase-like [Varroa jacobsoni]|uniref:Inosine triphosphate pyrophosphatase n=1 Tax=Varroa destructor TaxID=109461 RepID=A0A7M7JYR9_VARDE|nr:inosine triphosphate pyrophosphatase-like [Varroa destructor]XP_022702455.1 inosine triphosphate pyrophosphatase-like [Varroa jacobsoni]
MLIESGLNTNMAAKKITFVTGNKNKLQEVIKILGVLPGYELTSTKVDLPEYQGEIDHISREKCRAAAKHVHGPVIVEDTSLCFNALGGLPGPYIKWFLEKLMPEGLYKLLAGFEDKTAQAVCTLAYCESPNAEIHLFHGITDGEIVPPRGSRDFGWDACFQPKGYDKTYGELSSEVKNTISHRHHSLEKFRKFLYKEGGDVVE